MGAKNAALKAEFDTGDAQTKLEILQMMHHENAGLREQDTTMMEMMRKGNDDLETRFNALFKEQDDDFSSALSSEVESFENDLDSVEKNLEAKDGELADGLDELSGELEDLEDVLSAKDDELADKLAKIEAQLEHDKELTDLKAEMEH